MEPNWAKLSSCDIWALNKWGALNSEIFASLTLYVCSADIESAELVLLDLCAAIIYGSNGYRISLLPLLPAGYIGLLMIQFDRWHILHPRIKLFLVLLNFDIKLLGKTYLDTLLSSRILEIQMFKSWLSRHCSNICRNGRLETRHRNINKVN